MSSKMTTHTASELGWIRLEAEIGCETSDVWVIPFGAYISAPAGEEPIVTLSTYLPGSADDPIRDET